MKRKQWTIRVCAICEEHVNDCCCPDDGSVGCDEPRTVSIAVVGKKVQ